MARYTIEQVTLDEAGASADQRVYAGDPNGAVTAPAGSILLDTSTPATWQGQGGTVWTQLSPAGSGLVGTAPTVVDHLALWDDTTATTIKNSDILHVSGTGYAGLITGTLNQDLVVGVGYTSTGAIQAQVTDGTLAGGDARGDYATDWQRERTAQVQVASGDYSVIGGGRFNRALGSDSVVAGGRLNYAQALYCSISGGQQNIIDATGVRSSIVGGISNAITTAGGGESFIGGGRSNLLSSALSAGIVSGKDNTVSEDFSFVGGGEDNLVSGIHSSVVGGLTNLASGPLSFVGAGEGNEATGTRTIVLGGLDNVAAGDFSTILGGQDAEATEVYTMAWGRSVVADHFGEYAFGNAPLNAPGQSQASDITWSTTTQNAAPQNISLIGPVGSIDYLVPPRTTMTFDIQVSAHSNDGGDDAAGWIIRCFVYRPGTGGAVIIPNPDTYTLSTAGASGWTAAVSASGNNLIITVTGEISRIVNWSASARATRCGVPA